MRELLTALCNAYCSATAQARWHLKPAALLLQRALHTHQVNMYVLCNLPREGLTGALPLLVERTLTVDAATFEKQAIATQLAAWPSQWINSPSTLSLILSIVYTCSIRSAPPQLLFALAASGFVQLLSATPLTPIADDVCYLPPSPSLPPLSEPYSRSPPSLNTPLRRQIPACNSRN